MDDVNNNITASIKKTNVLKGERIASVRKEHKMSMRAFGERIGISSASVYKLESGENNPSEQTIRAICSEFNINRDWLLTGEGKVKGEPKDANCVLSKIRTYSRALDALEYFASMNDQEWEAFKTLLQNAFGAQ